MRTAGVDIGGTRVKIGVFDDDKMIKQTSFQTPKGNPQAVVDGIANALRYVCPKFVGVGTAGSVVLERGIVSASNLGWEGVPLRSMLQEQLNLPVWVENDAQAALMAEWHDGACKDAQCAVYLTLGTGIGGAMIVAGQPYRGTHYFGAEFGHMITHPNGPRCSCGRRGCLEYYASATAIKRMARSGNARDVFDAAKAGDKYSMGVFRRYVNELCIGLNNLIMIFDPEVIVMGGGLSGAGEFLSDACEARLREVFAETTDPLFCRVRTAVHQNDAGMIGAALLARHKLADFVASC